MNNSKKFTRVDSTKLLLCAVFVVFVFYPFFVMVSGITAEDFMKVITSPSFIPALKNSIRASVLSTIISVSIGMVLAFARGESFTLPPDKAKLFAEALRYTEL